MYYELDENNYLTTLSFGAILDNGIEYKGDIPNDLVENLGAYKLINDEFILDENKLNEMKKQISYQNEINEINEWLEEYDKQVVTYNRNTRLGINNEIDIEKLDNEAIEKINRLNELNKNIKI